MVHLVAYVQEKRGGASVIEDRILLQNVELALRTDGKAVRSVYLAPNRQALPFSEENGYCKVVVPSAAGYALVVFEY